MVERPSRWSVGGREARREVQEWLEGSLGGSGLVGRPLQRSVSGREAQPEVREWSGGPS